MRKHTRQNPGPGFRVFKLFHPQRQHREVVGKWRLFLRYLSVFRLPICFSTIVTFIWYEVWSRGYHNQSSADGYIEMTGVVMYIALYGLCLSNVIDGIKERIRNITIAYCHGNERDFLMYRDERIHPLYHVIIGIVAMGLLVLCGTLDYPSAASGIITMWPITFVLPLGFTMCRESERPDSIFLSKIPSLWRKKRPHRRHYSKKKIVPFIKAA